MTERTPTVDMLVTAADNIACLVNCHTALSSDPCGQIDDALRWLVKYAPEHRVYLMVAAQEAFDRLVDESETVTDGQ
jgi:hypothetical protein